MAFMTDRKRAEGLGATGTGTDHHWGMTKSSVALLVLIPLFVITFAGMPGQGYEAVVAYYGQPIPALIAALTIAVGFLHFKNGVQVLIEDYVHGFARKALIVATVCLSYGAAAAGVFAVVRLAL